MKPSGGKSTSLEPREPENPGAYELSHENFERFRKLIKQASGIFFSGGKAEALREGLAERAAANGAVSLDDYYRLITTHPQREIELSRMLDSLSITQTRFFRNNPQFDCLRRYIVPEIIGRKSAGFRTIRCWSAGCSTGQEAYSVAMSILDVLPNPETWTIEILGSDLNEQALEIARAGWYPEEHLTGVDRFHLERYFRPFDRGYRVVEPVRRLIKFTRHNLVRDGLPLDNFGTCDIVFCRNVIVFFNYETARYVLDHFFDVLNPGAYLFLGHSETLWKMSAKYSLVEMGDAFIYRKPLPMSLNGRRFIPDRRVDRSDLPPWVGYDRRACDIERRKKATQPLPDSWRFLQTAAAEQGQVLSDAMIKIEKLLDLGEFGSAVKALEEILKGDGKNAEAHFLLGLALEKSDQTPAAIDAYRRAIGVRGDMAIAHFHLAGALERTGDLKNARSEYRQAAAALRQNHSRGKNGAIGANSLIDLCEWKIENLGGL